MERRSCNHSLHSTDEEELSQFGNGLRVGGQWEIVVAQCIFAAHQITLKIEEVRVQCLNGEKIMADADVGDVGRQVVLGRKHDLAATI